MTPPTRQQTTILTCLRLNVENARNKGLREFAQRQLDDYEKRLSQAARKKPEPPPAFLRFLEP
jgi:hypothetical protein